MTPSESLLSCVQLCRILQAKILEWLSLQGIFPTWESNHCRRILYQLSYQGSSDSKASFNCIAPHAPAPAAPASAFSYVVKEVLRFKTYSRFVLGLHRFAQALPIAAGRDRDSVVCWLVAFVEHRVFLSAHT